ncbi:prion-inhibition and propagation-domain-containing protein [Mycena rosella]|uniref:Prion-inhibition and propagation-domain-containing protein n=1 Tax=Mycena rosella TaxID=1033263 RepID=A0AAD7FRC7_MYCRO|nr:prion-inhibition and propagation-domain-containing protein [Mycena rosella]
MEVALPVISLLGQCYSGALQAYIWIQTAVEFPDTAAKLVLQLEVERIRLQLWGRNSGADSDALYPGLVPFEPLIFDILTKITQLLRDSDKLRDNYGLVSSMDDETRRIGSEEQIEKRRLLAQLKDALRSALVFGAVEKRKKADGSTPPLPPVVDHDALLRRTYERIRWVVVSKSRFENLISDLRHLTNNLNELLRESQLVDLCREWHSIEMRMVARTDDQPGLEALQEATEGDVNCRDMFSMARRKSLVIGNGGDAGACADSPTVLSQDDFDLPNDFATSSRSLAIYRPLRVPHEQKYVLIERKYYDTDISAEDKAKLQFRLYNLINLVNAPSSEFLSCIGYWSAPQDHCWCLVYRFPLHGSTPSPGRDLSTPLSSQPLSLLLFVSSDAFRPPLEARLTLACRLASIFSRFYGSKWLHKGVRSENIVFPLAGSGGVYDISRPIVAGFEYSRQYTEQATIDHTPYNRGHAIYRHPRYQGDAANGYRMAYDIYSFGLVLAEIAWWIPLESFLRAVTRKGAPVAEPNKRFGPDEAKDLKGMVAARVRKELAFRVGSDYKAVVEWCLTRGDEEQAATDADLAIEFYTKVAVPLQSLSGSVGRVEF